MTDFRAVRSRSEQAHAHAVLNVGRRRGLFTPEMERHAEFLGKINID
jgi:hypothetical protein